MGSCSKHDKNRVLSQTSKHANMQRKDTYGCTKYGRVVPERSKAEVFGFYGLTNRLRHNAKRCTIIQVSCKEGPFFYFFFSFFFFFFLRIVRGTQSSTIIEGGFFCCVCGRSPCCVQWTLLRACLV